MTKPKNPKRPRRRAEAELAGLAPKVSKLLETESDRGAILILGAYLDEILALIVRAACISDEAADDMLELRKPAGDFDSRIRTAFAFGLIHSDEVGALRILQKLRNKAAHFERGGRGFDVLFDSPSTADQVEALSDKMGFGKSDAEGRGGRTLFIVCARFLAVRLLLRLALVRRNAEPPTTKELANHSRATLKDTPMGKAVEQIEESLRAGDFEPFVKYNAALGRELEKRLSRHEGEKR